MTRHSPPRHKISHRLSAESLTADPDGRLHDLERNLAELRDSERRYRGLVESQQDLVVRVDSSFRFTFVNDAACRTLGRPREELLGSAIVPLVHPYDLSRTLATIEGLSLPPHRAVIESRTRATDGWRWMSWEACAIFDDLGCLLEYQGVGRDMTEFKRLELDLLTAKAELEERVRQRTAELEQAMAERAHIAAALEANDRRFRLIETAAPVGLFETDGEGACTYVNAAFADLAGWTADRMLGPDWLDVVAPGGEATILRHWRTAVSGWLPFAEEVRLGKPDGKLLWVLCQAMPRFGADGSFLGHIGTFTDISHQKEVEQVLRERGQELRAAKEAAERANLAKSKFLAAASHDLRQPLQAASLFLAVLQHRIGGDERFILDRLQQSLEALEGLLNALLDVSKLEAGVTEPEPSAFPIGDLLRQLADEFGPRAIDQGLRFRLVQRDLWIETDRMFLERILRNLLSNALAYTSRGGILLGVRRRADRMRIEVWDTGIGIPGDRLDDIFEDFVQINNPHRNRDRGLGLGLAIVKRMARLIDCRIAVRSRLGRGSVFVCELPLVAAPVPPAPSERPIVEQNDTDGAVIAVIDDDAGVRDGLGLLLSNWGHATVVAPTVAETLDRFREIDLWPDLVIADYQLADAMTGLDAIDVIRAAANRPVPAIVLTGDTAPEHLLAAKRKGYILLHKPIRQEHLRAVLGSLLEGSSAERN